MTGKESVARKTERNKKRGGGEIKRWLCGGRRGERA